MVDSDYIYVSPYIMFNSLLDDSDRIARFVLKSTSFEFAKPEVFLSVLPVTFMNLNNARLVLNAKCKIAAFMLIVSDLPICDKQNIV